MWKAASPGEDLRGYATAECRGRWSGILFSWLFDAVLYNFWLQGVMSKLPLWGRSRFFFFLKSSLARSLGCPFWNHGVSEVGMAIWPTQIKTDWSLNIMDPKAVRCMYFKLKKIEFAPLKILFFVIWIVILGWPKLLFNQSHSNTKHK